MCPDKREDDVTMIIEREDSQQNIASFMATGNDGIRMQAASATCHIRPGKGLTLSVDVFDGVDIGADSMDGLRASIAAFMAAEVAKAASMGVPVALPADSA